MSEGEGRKRLSEMTAEDWAGAEWHEVTTTGDPERVFVRGQYRTPQDGPRWEYREVVLKDAHADDGRRKVVYLNGPRSLPERRASLLAEMGAAGWELAAVLPPEWPGQVYLFKREGSRG